jgi:hypothetical protein
VLALAKAGSPGRALAAQTKAHANPVPRPTAATAKAAPLGLQQTRRLTDGQIKAANRSAVEKGFMSHTDRYPLGAVDAGSATPEWL